LPSKADRIPPSPWKAEVNRIRPPRPPLSVGELRHGDAPRFERFDRDVTTAVQVLLAYSTVLDSIRTAQLPGPVSSTFLWCFTHETDRPHSLELRGWSGAPVPCPELVVWSGRKDQPGEAAVHPNVARDHEAKLVKLLDQFHRVVEDLRLLGGVYVRRAPTDSDRLALEKANRPAEPGCACCQKAGHWSAPYTKHPTAVKGILPEPLLLCRWCWRFVEKFLRVPSPAELGQFYDPAAKWVEVRVSASESVRYRK
jgi:hypothetical protein